jgi:dihydrofolate reductase
MGKLLFSMITSLDGYVEDDEGSILWGRPDDEVGRFVNDIEPIVGTYLFGRRMYETMVFWETVSLDDGSQMDRDFAEQWRAADKIVYSTSLEAVSSERTRIERQFDPNAIEEIKAAQKGTVAVAGPNLAAQALEAGLVDECMFFLAPVVLGGGKPALPAKFRSGLELVGERGFKSGFVFLHYRLTLPR